MKRTHIFWYFERDSFINHRTKTFRDILNIISNTKIDEALRYIILNSLRGDSSSFTQKSRYFAKLTKEYTCRNPTLAKCGGEAQHLEKLGTLSPPGLLNV
jgi:hypothetical protein